MDGRPETCEENELLAVDKQRQTISYAITLQDHICPECGVSFRHDKIRDSDVVEAEVSRPRPGPSRRRPRTLSIWP